MQSPVELLKVLFDARVDFVLVGGVAAVAHGSATFTQDIDVAAAFSAENLRRLTEALAPYHPRFALTVDKRPVDKTPEELSQFKNLYLLTDLGRLDLLSEIPPIGSFEQVRARAEEIELLGYRCRVISLDDLIEVKESLGREKDRAVLMELRAIRDRRGR